MNSYFKFKYEICMSIFCAANGIKWNSKPLQTDY